MDQAAYGKIGIRSSDLLMTWARGELQLAEVTMKYEKWALIIALTVSFASATHVVASTPSGSESFEHTGDHDAFLQGAIFDFLKVEYCTGVIDVSVKDGHVYLSHAPSSYGIRQEMVEYISSLPGVKEVTVLSTQDTESKVNGKFGYEKGRLMPDYPMLWNPWIANPREVNCSLAYRTGDRVLGSSIGAVSFGTEYPFYRWHGVNFWGYQGDLEVSIEGCLYAVFNMNPHPPSGVTYSHELINADYYIGIPLTYAHDRWTYRLRLYHISSHLGDQYMVDHPGVTRRNLEFEAVDLKAAYQLTDTVQLYGGIGDYVISDKDFPMKSLYIDYGFQIFMPWIRDAANGLIWEPFVGVFLQNQQYEKWTFNQNYAVGIRSRHLDGNSTSISLALEFYDGRSQDGMFSLDHTSYGQLKLSYAF